MLVAVESGFDDHWLSAGAPKQIRTADLLITNQLLYQLSYEGLCHTVNTNTSHDHCQKNMWATLADVF